MAGQGTSSGAWNNRGVALCQKAESLSRLRRDEEAVLALGEALDCLTCAMEGLQPEVRGQIEKILGELEEKMG